MAGDEVLAGHGRVDGNADVLALDHTVELPFDISTRGNIELVGRSLTLTGEWRDVSWPLAGAAEYRSTVGTYSLQGPLDALEVKASTVLEGAAFPRTAIELAGVVDETGIHLEPAVLDLLGGRVSARGRVDWSPAIHWDVEVGATELNPGDYWPDWPGRLTGAVLAYGALDTVGLKTSVDVKSITGYLRGFPVSASGALEIAGERGAGKRIEIAKR